MNNFYSTTGEWWGSAESKITERDHKRAALLRLLCPNAKTVLELGCGYGNTAAATANAGYDVVANELSDRISFAKKFESQKMKGYLRFIKGDFYAAELGSSYDVVTYWNGFGIGTDSEQRKLLGRIANDWLNQNGKALIDIGNPFVRASWAGDKEHKGAKPEHGYNHTIDELTDYDPVNNRFVDTWWESDKPERKITQTLRNYTPADLMLLLEGTGLRLERIYVQGLPLELDQVHTGNQELLAKEQEYLALLTRL